MPIYEFHCTDNNKIYCFFARSLRYANLVPPCPDNPSFTMTRLVSAFAVNAGGNDGAGHSDRQGNGTSDAGLEDVMQRVDQEFASMDPADRSDPRILGKMMRKMSESTGEKMTGPMQEMIRRIEAGDDPASLEEYDNVLEIPEIFSYSSPNTPHLSPNGASPKPIRDPFLYDFQEVTPK